MSRFIWTVRGSKKLHHAETLDQVHADYCALWDAAMKANGTCIRGGNVSDESGKPVARISQNGNVWPLAQWYPGQLPLAGKVLTDAEMKALAVTPREVA